MNKDELIEKLDLQPLEGEGGLYSTIYRDELSNAIYFMVVSPDSVSYTHLTLPTNREV